MTHLHFPILLAVFLSMASCTPEEIHPQSISVTPSFVSLIKGETTSLTTRIIPAGAVCSGITWSSSDEKVATVSSDGMVTAVAPGEATITASASGVRGTGKVASCEVTVKPGLPDGALSGEFSIRAYKKVHFSKGNLQATYNGTGYAWGFAANQYDCVGEAAGNTTISNQSKGAVVDLFGWSTTATDYGISASRVNSDYYGDFKDWGKVFDNKGIWRTLSKDEWKYLFESSRYKYGVTVCGHANCVIIAPDGYTKAIESSYNEATWPAAEAAGLVCLPAAGFRNGSYVDSVGEYGWYWSSSQYDSDNTCYLAFEEGYNVSADYAYFNKFGLSVRLVIECW